MITDISWAYHRLSYIRVPCWYHDHTLDTQNPCSAQYTLTTHTAFAFYLKLYITYSKQCMHHFMILKDIGLTRMKVGSIVGGKGFQK